MEELEELQADLTRYQALLDLTTDETAREAIEIMIRETEERLAEIENERSEDAGAGR
jgi:hypothetical protein